MWGFLEFSKKYVSRMFLASCTLQCERTSRLKLSEMRNGQQGKVRALKGAERFLDRITSIGITIGCPISIMQNYKKRPVLVYARDSAIALDRADCDLIDVEVAR